ncbi:hypothetical protein PENTCL1PPCAC_9496, partial [Pristionchus entomophagus]
KLFDIDKLRRHMKVWLHTREVDKPMIKELVEELSSVLHEYKLAGLNQCETSITDPDAEGNTRQECDSLIKDLFPKALHHPAEKVVAVGAKIAEV